MRYTTEEKRQLVMRYQNGESAAHICAEMGIARSTFYSWVKPFQTTVTLSRRRSRIDAQTAERRALYRRKRRGEDVDGEIDLITQSLRPVRWELRVCRQIEANIPHVREQMEQYQRTPQQQTIPSKEKSKSKERRRFYGSER